LQSLGYVYIAQEKFEQAAKYYEQAIGLNALPAEPHKQAVYTLAQIYATLGEYQKTIDLMVNWFKVAENPPADAYIMVANAYAALDKFREAYPYVTQAIQKADRVREDWYKLALGIQFELRKYPEAAQTLEVLVANWPDNKTYWKQLSGIYLELSNEPRALATMALAYQRDALTESEDLLNLARLYMLNNVPAEAGKILEKELASGRIEATQKNYELLAQAWVQAREFEKGTVALGKAAEMADDGELFIRQAQIFVSLADWSRAANAARKALEKGGMDQKKTGQAWLLVGTAAAEQKDFDTAIEAFTKASGYEDTRRTAKQWLNFVQTEQQVSSLN